MNRDWPFKRMHKGETVSIPLDPPNDFDEELRIRSYAYIYANRNGKKFKTHKIDDGAANQVTRIK